MRPFVSFLNAALHGIFRPKGRGVSGKISAGKNDGGTTGGKSIPPEGGRKEEDENGADALSKVESSVEE